MYAPLSGLVGAQPPTDIWVPSTTQNFGLGMQMPAYDPYFGWGSFVYAKAIQACGVGRLCFMTGAWGATDMPNTANTGYPIFSARADMLINTFGWFQYAGLAPWLADSSVATKLLSGDSSMKSPESR